MVLYTPVGERKLASQTVLSQAIGFFKLNKVVNYAKVAQAVYAHSGN